LVCIEVATIATTSPLSPRERIHRLRHGVAVAGRMENGKWTREQTLLFEQPSKLWEWLNCRRQTGKPLWIFSQTLSRVLSLTGFWSKVESCDFRLSQPPMAAPSRTLSARLTKLRQRQQSGIIVDSDPPTAVMAWNRAGWKLICLDLR